ncbi:kinase-like domain-containing protein, partial [Mariannaea sp. PMI_226]
MSRKVVPGLPRTQTFKRQRSEQRVNLAPIEPLPEERRAVSVDRRSRGPRISSTSEALVEDPHTSAPGLLSSPQDDAPSHLLPVASPPESHVEDMFTEAPLEQVASKVDEVALTDECAIQDNLSTSDAHSMTTSQYDAMISEELERVWILNLSMHFRDRSKREKFFVTYREEERFWRRVTISLDYRNAPPNSLEMDLIHTHYQREKSAKIYEAIRESLRDIQFYDTVTNLKLQTTDGRLHVHVVEDGNEIIQYPAVSQIKHLNCRRVRERDIKFDSHMSGFVYKVQVNGQTLIKKEIPSPETIDEFLYEVNALDSLRYSPHVIQFHGVVVDDHDEFVKGLLISYAEQGALIDLIYETCKDGDYDFPWATREKWARQIVQGLSDIHESGFVQGDFTLSNIVIDEHNDAKIIDINRRGCPVGWEPPEATQLIECNQRISMYIGVKSDLYQLGMVLWALATQEDEPETQGRPLILGPEVNIPDWYRQMAEICLSDDPRSRRQASELLQMFPTPSSHHDRGRLNPPTMSVDEDYALNQYLVDDYPEIQPEIRTVEQPSDWSYVSRPYAEPSPVGFEPYYYTRGRSPPSPLPSNYEGYDDSCRIHDLSAWA